MAPLYFPFTFVSQQMAEALSRYFRHISVYQASAKPVPDEMQPPVQSGFLNIRIPVTSDQPRFDVVVKNFRDWADLHYDSQGITTAFLRDGTDPIPFFTGSATSQILAEIKGNLHNEQKPIEPDPLFSARVFLEFAQEFDRQSHEINRDLGAYEANVQNLFNHIKGERERLTDGHSPWPDRISTEPSEYMILRRLEAWNHLLQEDTVSSGVFVTSSRSIFEHMMDKIPTAEEIYHSDTLPVSGTVNKTIQRWQDSLIAKLTSLAQNKFDASIDKLGEAQSSQTTESKVSFTVCLMPDLPPHMCFAKSISKEFSHSDKHHRSPSIRNTLIGLIEFKI